jgi:aspartyl-tRNA(Asn)/glutamyl-tRNA(Gln) amidotransferase subunit B
MDYEAIIGLEVHAQLLTESKIFCGCSTKYGSPPNSQTCPVCLGMPGVLPVLNKKAVTHAIKMVLAVGGKVNPSSIFARKNYFYPDLPKGYQISQYEKPLAEGGWIEIDAGKHKKKKIRVRRIHLEEDAGKSLHSEEDRPDSATLVDMNRCGVPLVEVVSEPDIASPEEACLYFNKIRQLVQYLGICAGNMEQGNLRCDANVSVRTRGETAFGVNTEVKNMNSFRGVERALTFEIQRQTGILKNGGKIEHQTLLWDEKLQEVFTMRTKEESPDYRYFPEPDLVKLVIPSHWIEKTRKTLPELPEQKRQRFAEVYKIPSYDVEVLTVSKDLADWYEEGLRIYPHPKIFANWVMGEVLRELKEKTIEITDFKLTPGDLADLLELVDKGLISGKIAKDVFKEMSETGKKPTQIVQQRGLVQVNDKSEIEILVEAVLSENGREVEEYLAGKQKLFGFFVGEVMKKSKGKANPGLVNEILKEKLKR